MKNNTDGSITILGKPYSVRYTDDEQTGGKSIMGAANRMSQTIVLNKGCATKQKNETLLHEILHVIDGELILGLSEESVARIAVGLHSAGIRVRNPMRCKK